MLFSSITFVCFFLPVVLLVNYILGFSKAAQNVWLLAASLFFYAWGEPVYVIIMVISIIINYIFGLLVDPEKNYRPAFRKTVLILDIIVNLGILFVFKYMGFICRNINEIFQAEVIKVKAPAMPIGISFFTFQALSYVIDVYRSDAKVEKNPLYIGLYISFFPQLIAGPIVKFTTIANQIRYRFINFEKFAAGVSRFAMGFSKKILLSNNFATIADYIFELNTYGSPVSVVLAWIGAFAYTFQIFFDFSAYSDMAIGLGLMFGFKFDENFNYPYISKSITEFWRRWHISLSTWFREYVYFPLGGSRTKNQDKAIRNLLIVWVLTGVWHGAEWTFILWGLWNFIFLFMEKLINFQERKIPDFFRHLYSIWVFVMGWVFFRAEGIKEAFAYIRNMYGVSHNAFFSDNALMFLREYWIYWVFGILFSIPVAKLLEKKIVESKSKAPAAVSAVLYPAALLLLFAVSFACLVRGSYNPFIYFNF